MASSDYQETVPIHTHVRRIAKLSVGVFFGSKQVDDVLRFVLFIMFAIDYVKRPVRIT